jgi:formylglycine-generating enzyme required for sulfatase activity
MRGCAPTGEATIDKGRRPVINVSWDQAKAYVEWLARMTGKPYRLLSEAEWEYAARADTQTAYYFGDDATQICRYANLADQSYRRAGYTDEAVNCDDGQAVTAPVGSYPANAFGLHDMHGNVWQWVEDPAHDNYQGAPTDGRVWMDGGDERRRMARGGSWDYLPRLLRSAFRSRNPHDNRDSNLGFRVGRTLSARTGATMVSPGAQ